MFQAVISYLFPMKAAVGVRAETKNEAESILKDNFSDCLNFEIHELEPATADQEKQLTGSICH